jgi:putative glutamine amidotransferase
VAAAFAKIRVMAANPSDQRDEPAPLIGVTTSEVRPTQLTHPRPHSDPARPEMALGMTYMRTIQRAGGVPVVLPPLAGPAVATLLDRVDGICLSGGPDIDPTAYRGDAHPQLGPTWRELDELEIGVAREADRRGIPILGICRGAQTLNVLRGGDLHQHVPELGDGVEHRQSGPGEVLAHTIEIEPGTRLAEIVGDGPLEVNSFHHQAVNELGRDLIVSARSRDGLIEAIEDPRHPFLIGLQWHAEFLDQRPAEAQLFRAFVDASRRRRTELAEGLEDDGAPGDAVAEAKQG